MDSSPVLDDPASKTPQDGDIPSCQGCRRRKLKCSREQPICGHCKRLEAPCVYDAKKNKPGIKLGAVGSLSRRVEVLEEALLKSQEQGCPSHAGDSCGGHSNCNGNGSGSSHGLGDSPNVVGILSMLARELHKLNSSKAPGRTVVSQAGSPDMAETIVVSPTTSHGSSRVAIDGYEVVGHPHNQPRKRRRVDSCGNPNIELSFPLEDLHSIATSLPPPGLLEDVITAHFNFIQPWIPILHETNFRRRVHDPEQLPQLVVVLHAMTVAALRFVDNSESRLSAGDVERMTARSRNIVILTATDSLSVENLQALIIVAFNDIGNGDASKAWSVIGSLTRTVEYLQLSIESDYHGSQPLLSPLPSIPDPQNWTEEEERRRVFWNIFCLDRFCSVTTGWNTSLTSDDVHRRLPADGGLWHKEEPVSTPYFGIWDRSAAKIGNSIAFLPGNYPSPEQASDGVAPMTSTAALLKGPNSVDMTTVGAFAYCIEATESLSRVTTYFLQQRINFDDRQEVGSWLTRFKELDLRLVHWKMFLPQKWRDSNISRQPAMVDMDPNLTLAHVTHNASMILLHQRIAYPEAQWLNIIKLPSFCSAETCQIAAIETATITQKYLKYKPDRSPVTSQFAFCVFISARVLLVHWRHYGAELAPEFWILVENLEEMARRWNGILTSRVSKCLAGTYASSLRDLWSSCMANARFTIDVLGYSGGGGIGIGAHPARRPPPSEVSPRTSNPVNGQGNTNSPGLDHSAAHFGQGAAQPLIDGMSPMPMAGTGFTPKDVESQPDELSAISHILMDQQFMSMDRIISFDDNLFTAPPNGSLTWQG